MENLNISEVLFYAPKGLMLYSPIFGEVEFIEIDEDNCIVVRDKHDNLRWFYEYGTYFPSDESNYAEGECLLFPSIEHRCWDNWQNILFPKSIGSVCVDTLTNNKFILDHNGTFFSDGTGSLFLTLVGNSGNYLLNSVYASPSQTKEFFEELEKSDYEWVSDTVVRKKQNKPKFKVGDWLQFRNAKPFLVKEITRQGYVNGDDCLLFSWENETHLWTIEDAKDGDVLAGSKNDVILMFRGIGNKEWDDVIDYHCYYDCYRKNFIVQEDVKYWGNTENNQLKPATKEQRDLLFQKMKEEGYEWNAEKKELKKIDALNVGDCVVNNNSGDVFQVTEIKDDEYCLWPLYGEICGYLRIIDVDTDYHLWTIEDAKDGDVLVTPPIKGSENNVQIFIFKGINNRDYVDNCIEYYCRVCEGVFYENKTGFMGTTSSTFYPATKGQRDFLSQKMKEKGYEWDAEKKELKKIGTPQPKFKVGDIIRNEPTGVIMTIKEIKDDSYITTDGTMLLYKYQDRWELAGKSNLSLEDKVAVLMDEILALKERVKALEIQEIKQCSDKNKLDSLESKMIILDSHNINERLDALESRVFPISENCKSPNKEEDNVTLDEENESK